jgi:PAS domain S-box-containing protein
MNPGHGDEHGDKKELIKRMLKELHECDDSERVKEDFKEVLRTTSAEEIARIEDELVRDGMPREKLHSMCDLHLAVFKESIEGASVEAPPGHPLGILMEEHRLMLDLATRLKAEAEAAAAAKSHAEARPHVHGAKDIVGHIRASENHYLREENVIFPYLEKIRELKRTVSGIADTLGPEANIPEVAARLERAALALAEMLSTHFYKENNILFPTAMRALTDEEWLFARAQFDEIGFTSFYPNPPAWHAGDASPGPSRDAPAGMVPLEPGPLSLNELESILNSLPVDISFVDTEHRVRYFNETPERIFTRTKAVIGRTVEGCHPDKSLHVVNKILDDLAAGKRDKAEFWIELGGRLVHIRYFPVRDRKGQYLGCLEVTQDLTELKKIEGQKRLLD